MHKCTGGIDRHIDLASAESVQVQPVVAQDEVTTQPNFDPSQLQ